ncbi:hypothetical protein [Dehalobacter restrictus]|uniref:SynChlorMet cassette protein ScmC n=1 Tax=Dehalobacter restrictus (strain DSM 9455 / PER-K23) TaxID=871738 RepID=A0ABM5P6R0_DEHRP|nr:hypothetical protein [Dehalobacter restrictus]AHF10356.1 hypothetical protein DEHRE_09920 [Dehalobacter restrictus DSM 9455]
MRYDIAGLIIDFQTDLKNMPEEFTSYVSESDGAADCEVDFLQCSEVSPPQGRFLYEDGLKWYTHDENEDGFSVYLSTPLYPFGPVCKLTAAEDWRQVSIEYIKDLSDQQLAVFKFFSNIVIRNLILLHQGIILHASAIKWQDKGIAFTAPSGTGKSTQAQLWEAYRGAAVINDDTPILKRSAEKITIHGTPWCGSSHKHLNTSAPLNTIIVLEQSNKNSLHRLQEPELSSCLLPRFLLPYHDQRLMDLALGHIARIIASTPIYLLQCRPDQEAVELVHKVILNELDAG